MSSTNNASSSTSSAKANGGWTGSEKSESAVKITFNTATRSWERERVLVIIAQQPFSRGCMRMAHEMRELGEDGSWQVVKCVAKFFDAKALAKHGFGVTREAFENDIIAQATSQDFANRFNQLNPPKPVKFVSAWILELTSRPGKPLCAGEHMLNGEYVKHNNNLGDICSTRNTPQAFSHYTYEVSNRTEIVTDIQGTEDTYTDPQIHTTSGRGYGLGNRGKDGINDFVRTHKCNALCRRLGLPDLHNPAPVAAPAVNNIRAPSPQRTNLPAISSKNMGSANSNANNMVVQGQDENGTMFTRARLAAAAAAAAAAAQQQQDSENTAPVSPRKSKSQTKANPQPPVQPQQQPPRPPRRGNVSPPKLSFLPHDLAPRYRSDNEPKSCGDHPRFSRAGGNPYSLSPERQANAVETAQIFTRDAAPTGRMNSISPISGRAARQSASLNSSPVGNKLCWNQGSKSGGEESLSEAETARGGSSIGSSRSPMWTDSCDFRASDTEGRLSIAPTPENRNSWQAWLDDNLPVRAKQVINASQQPAAPAAVVAGGSNPTYYA